MKETVTRSNMASKGCIVVTKYFLFVFNLIFFFLGGVMLGFGLWILFDKNSFISVLETSSIPLHLWSYLLSSLGTFTMMMGFLGCIGALKEVKCMLGIYFTLLVFLLASQITVGVLVYTQRRSIEKQLGKAVQNLIQTYGETDEKLQSLEESWDFIQMQNITSFNFTKETGFCFAPTNPFGVTLKSCKTNVFDWMRENILSIMIVSIGVSLVEFGLLVFSFILCLQQFQPCLGIRQPRHLEVSATSSNITVHVQATAEKTNTATELFAEEAQSQGQAERSEATAELFTETTHSEEQ